MKFRKGDRVRGPSAGRTWHIEGVVTGTYPVEGRVLLMVWTGTAHRWADPDEIELVERR